MERTPTSAGRQLAKRLLATVGLLSVVAAVVGGLAFATFTSTTSVDQNVGAGTVAFAPLTPAGTGQRLSVGASDIAPGDSIQRAVTLTNIGTIDMEPGVIRLTTTATTSSLLDSGANGLTLRVDRCSVAWAESAVPYTYTCPATTTTSLATGPVLVASAALAGVVTTAGAPNHLRVTLTLPTAADNTYQAQSSVIAYTFAGQQRPGTAR